MERKSLFDADRAVTPVIGIVLMVAIAVILGALVSIQAFGLFGVANDPGPTMDFSFDYDTSAVGTGAEDSWGTTESSGSYDGILEITFQGGEKIPPERLTVLRDSNESAVSVPVTSERLDVGTTLRVWVKEEWTVRVVWRDPGGEKSAAVAVWDDGN